MMHTTRITLIGHFSPSLTDELSQIPGFSVTVANGRRASSFFEATPLPAIAVMEYGEHWQAAQKELASMPISSRPVVLAILPNEDVSLLHDAMRSGARDYLVQPVEANTLKTVLQKLAQEIAPKPDCSQGQTISFISCNSNGESAFLATNFAHIMAATTNQNTSLLDLDLQLSSLPLLLEVAPERTFLQAIDAIDTLDEDAIGAYQVKHKSGLSLMALGAGEIALPGEVSLDATSKLLNILNSVTDCVVINLPRLIDPLTTLAVERSNGIVIVIEQSLTSLNYANGLLKILREDLEISPEKIHLVINHYNKKSQIGLPDISKALAIKPEVVLPDDTAIYENENYGLLLLNEARNSSVTKGLVGFVKNLTPKTNDTRKPGLLRRLFSTQGGQR